METLFPGLVQFRGAFERPRELIELVEGIATWGAVGYNGSTGARTAEGFPLSVAARKSAALTAFDAEIERLMRWALRRYVENYPISVHHDEGYEVVRYRTGADSLRISTWT